MVVATTRVRDAAATAPSAIRRNRGPSWLLGLGGRSARRMTTRSGLSDSKRPVTPTLSSLSCSARVALDAATSKNCVQVISAIVGISLDGSPSSSRTARTVGFLDAGMSTASPRARTSILSLGSGFVTAPTPPNSGFPPGMILAGRYEVIRPLGSGGQGVVYEVFDHHLQQLSAFKLLTAIPSSGPWAEAAMLTQLSGKFLLPVRNADLVSGQPYVVTEVARHGTAEDHLATGLGVAPGLAVLWTLHASRGVARMHDHELLHNDIKPGNLFLDEQGDVLLGDLGFASRMDAQGRGALVGGTPATMAPEVAAAALATIGGSILATPRPCSARSDVYSLGATLYWLLAGTAPFTGATHADVLLQVIAGAAAPLRDVAPHVPQGLAEVIGRAMSAAPSDRYQSASDLDYALARQKRPSREWRRIPNHPGHTTCFSGERRSSTLSVCVAPTGVRSQQLVTVRHASGRRAAPDTSIALSALPRHLRSVFRTHA